MCLGYLATDQFVTNSQGHTFGLWAAGHTVYEQCIIAVNLIVLQMTNNWTWIGILLIFLETISYYVTIFLLGWIFPTNEIYSFPGTWFMNGTRWLCTILAIAVVMLIDYGFDMTRHFVMEFILKWEKPGKKLYMASDDCTVTNNRSVTKKVELEMGAIIGS